jgi:hypothetical protein
MHAAADANAATKPHAAATCFGETGSAEDGGKCGCTEKEWEATVHLGMPFLEC